MKISTSRFGEIEVLDSSLFELIVPILGYENEKNFALIEHKENSKFRWLQSTTNPELAFVVTVAGFFGFDYTFELPEDTQEELNIQDSDEILALSMVCIPRENPKASTINLLAPLIFNVKNHKGSQVILAGSNFVVNTPLLKEEAVC